MSVAIGEKLAEGDASGSDLGGLGDDNMAMSQPHLVDAALREVGLFIPVRRRVMKVRNDAATGIVFVTLPGRGRKVRRHILNRTAAVMYQLFDGTRTVAEVIDLFTAKFPDLDATRIAGDLLLAVRTLHRKGLIDLEQNQDCVKDHRRPEG